MSDGGAIQWLGLIGAVGFTVARCDQACGGTGPALSGSDSCVVRGSLCVAWGFRVAAEVSKACILNMMPTRSDADGLVLFFSASPNWCAMFMESPPVSWILSKPDI